MRTIRGFKRALLAQDDRQLRIMAERYLEVEHAIEANIEALSEKAARLAAEGRTLTFNQAYLLERFQRLQVQLVEELARFNGWAADLITQRQRDLITQAIENSSTVLGNSGRSGYGLIDRIAHEAVHGMAGMAGDGSPLSALLQASYPGAREAMMRELVNAVALGVNPRVTARALMKAAGTPLQRAMNIARTEQLRAYREASRAYYREAGVTTYQRIATLDERTCIACLVADGEYLPSASEFDEHCMGRCDLVPVVPDARNTERETGKDWFAGQGEATQRQMMGPGRFDAWKAGDVQWGDLAEHVHDPVWGGAYQVRSLRDLGVKRTSGTAVAAA